MGGSTNKKGWCKLLETFRITFINSIRDDEQKRISSNRITHLAPSEILVFGSNLQGVHGGGAARMAHEHFGAV